jgi:hypothetical protein
MAARPPERLSARALAQAARATAAALALGAVVGLGSAAAAPPIEVRDRPPATVPMRTLFCEVTTLTRDKGGRVIVQATCPQGPLPQPGAVGTLQDAKGPIKDGQVKVTKVAGTTITGETQLKKPVPAKKVLFYVPPH